MPQADLVHNSDIAKKPNGCGCGCQDTPTPPRPNPWDNCCPPSYPPYPPYLPEYPYPCPVNPGVGSIEAQIAKLSKKSAVIRKMIDNLVNKSKSIVISIGCGASYNFGCFLNKEAEETEYGKSILAILQAELDAIKAKIIELTGELEVADEEIGNTESTVTG